jgi:hypothetical protein
MCNRFTDSELDAVAGSTANGTAHNVWAIIDYYLYQQLSSSSSSVCYPELPGTVDSIRTSHIGSLVGVEGIHSEFWPNEKTNANQPGLECGGL